MEKVAGGRLGGAGADVGAVGRAVAVADGLSGRLAGVVAACSVSAGRRAYGAV